MGNCLVWPVLRLLKMIHRSYGSLALKAHLCLQNWERGSGCCVVWLAWVCHHKECEGCWRSHKLADISVFQK